MTAQIATPVIVADVDDKPTAVILSTQVAATAEANKGLPAGGTTGQALVKKSNANYESEWKTVGGSGEIEVYNVVVIGGIIAKGANTITHVRNINEIAKGAEVFITRAGNETTLFTGVVKVKEIVGTEPPYSIVLEGGTATEAKGEVETKHEKVIENLASFEFRSKAANSSNAIEIYRGKLPSLLAVTSEANKGNLRTRILFITQKLSAWNEGILSEEQTRYNPTTKEVETGKKVDQGQKIREIASSADMIEFLPGTYYINSAVTAKWLGRTVKAGLVLAGNSCLFGDPSNPNAVNFNIGHLGSEAIGILCEGPGIGRTVSTEGISVGTVAVNHEGAEAQPEPGSYAPVLKVFFTIKYNTFILTYKGGAPLSELEDGMRLEGEGIPLKSKIKEINLIKETVTFENLHETPAGKVDKPARVPVFCYGAEVGTELKCAIAMETGNSIKNTNVNGNFIFGANMPENGVIENCELGGWAGAAAVPGTGAGQFLWRNSRPSGKYCDILFEAEGTLANATFEGGQFGVKLNGYSFYSYATGIKEGNKEEEETGEIMMKGCILSGLEYEVNTARGFIGDRTLFRKVEECEFHNINTNPSLSIMGNITGSYAEEPVAPIRVGAFIDNTVTGRGRFLTKVGRGENGCGFYVKGNFSGNKLGDLTNIIDECRRRRQPIVRAQSETPTIEGNTGYYLGGSSGQRRIPVRIARLGSSINRYQVTKRSSPKESGQETYAEIFNSASSITGGISFANGQSGWYSALSSVRPEDTVPMTMAVTNIGFGEQEGEFPQSTRRGAKATTTEELNLGKGEESSGVYTLYSIGNVEEEEPGTTLVVNTFSDYPLEGPMKLSAEVEKTTAIGGMQVFTSNFRKEESYGTEPYAVKAKTIGECFGITHKITKKGKVDPVALEAGTGIYRAIRVNSFGAEPSVSTGFSAKVTENSFYITEVTKAEIESAVIEAGNLVTCHINGYAAEGAEIEEIILEGGEIYKLKMSEEWGKSTQKTSFKVNHTAGTWWKTTEEELELKTGYGVVYGEKIGYIAYNGCIEKPNEETEETEFYLAGILPKTGGTMKAGEVLEDQQICLLSNVEGEKFPVEHGSAYSGGVRITYKTYIQHGTRLYLVLGKHSEVKVVGTKSTTGKTKQLPVFAGTQVKITIKVTSLEPRSIVVYDTQVINPSGGQIYVGKYKASYKGPLEEGIVIKNVTFEETGIEIPAGEAVTMVPGTALAKGTRLRATEEGTVTAQAAPGEGQLVGFSTGVDKGAIVEGEI